MPTPTDPLYPDQWHFGLIGDIETIWKEFSGQGVHVAVYDTGVQYTHPDLAANYDASMHFTFDGITYDGAPLDGTAGHGTACAGLIGAVADNGVGGTGVAWGVTLTSVDYLNQIYGQAADIYAAAMLWAANFDIMSNSWGYTPGFYGYLNPNDPSSNAAIDLPIYEQVCATGRDGLGTIIVQAAGNQALNANGSGYNATRFTLTIAATEQDGFVADYSNYGASILVAAPASAVTTDMIGGDGYDSGDYTHDFNGTSAATPTVSGVVALMLEAAPGLGWRDVANILAASASHTGSALGGGGSGFEHGSWDLMNGSQWNGGGTMFHASYGYGMVDAFAAVRMAEAWGTLYGRAQTSANEKSDVVSYVGAAVNIPDSNLGTAEIDLVSTSNIRIESISVSVTINHTDGSDLRISLVAPDGTVIELFARDGDSFTFDGGVTWTFGVESLRDYSAAGSWSVLVSDEAAADIGTITGFEIEFFGTKDTKDDVYTFTDDYAALAAVEASRLTIEDFNGGIDWLNFAAIADKLRVNMAHGGEVRFGSVVAQIGGTLDKFENLYAGDGNDAIKGNRLGNQVIGARGNDALFGKDGSDDVDGGAGRDRLFGDGGRDTLHGGDGADTLAGGAGSDRLIGNGGDDRFDFGTGLGGDVVLDFNHNADVLAFDAAIWGGGMTAAQVVNTFASVIGGEVVFDFGGGNTVTLAGYGSLVGLAGDLILL